MPSERLGNPVMFKRCPSTLLNSIPIKDGQVIVTTDTLKIYTDIDTQRKELQHSETSEGSSNVMSLSVTKPENGVHLLVKYSSVEGSLADSQTYIDTRNNVSDRNKVRSFYYTGTAGQWTTCPSYGFGTGYDDMPAYIDLQDITLTDGKCAIYYAWYGEDGSLSDWRSVIFPSYVCDTPKTSGDGIKVMLVSAPPSNPDPSVLYLIPDLS